MTRMKTQAEVMDLEWIDLMLEAKKLGLSVEEIRAFFQEALSGEILGTYDKKNASCEM
ncbi:anti-repressor SinI family protein [Neobacillus thermocopriae]|uniref:anti-repressor SinI family protein n=1 Tax=Neobacillus thermocopriae TaxID=1215031 RepID=UPI002E1DD078|nr:anti-repressor SinI family protein [Neobacillus thermocopriae]MED3715097.1 anti-repressor SinI family protein [Neobacillus thermocopriae]